MAGNGSERAVPQPPFLCHRRYVGESINLGRWLTSLSDHQLQWYSFIGRVLGKALYEGILVDVSFANFFRKFAEDHTAICG